MKFLFSFYFFQSSLSLVWSYILINSPFFLFRWRYRSNRQWIVVRLNNVNDVDDFNTSVDVIFTDAWRNVKIQTTRRKEFDRIRSFYWPEIYNIDNAAGTYNVGSSSFTWWYIINKQSSLYTDKTIWILKNEQWIT